MDSQEELSALWGPSQSARELQRSTAMLPTYERKGDLIPLRLHNGHRLYRPDEVRRLAARLRQQAETR